MRERVKFRAHARRFYRRTGVVALWLLVAIPYVVIAALPLLLPESWGIRVPWGALMVGLVTGLAAMIGLLGDRNPPYREYWLGGTDRAWLGFTVERTFFYKDERRAELPHAIDAQTFVWLDEIERVEPVDGGLQLTVPHTHRFVTVDQKWAGLQNLLTALKRDGTPVTIHERTVEFVTKHPLAHPFLMVYDDVYGFYALRDRLLGRREARHRGVWPYVSSAALTGALLSLFAVDVGLAYALVVPLIAVLGPVVLTAWASDLANLRLWTEMLLIWAPPAAILGLLGLVGS